MRKLTFERAILMVLVVIIFVSTTEIREKYIEIAKNKFFNKASPTVANVQPGKNTGFPNMMLAADNLYKDGDYAGAAESYLALSMNNALSTAQRARANFRLGVCQYYLKNYQLAFDSFVKATNLNPTDSIAYNNAAVSAYRAKDMKDAIEYQSKALKTLPAVEYYYNLARMYEDNEQYDLAANNYMAVAVAEQNITETDKIDPVRVKEKVARLLSNSKSSVTSDMIIGLKLKNAGNEVFTVNDNDMEIKSADFTAKVENQKSSKNIVAEYDKKKNDPYNLISDMIWTVYKNGIQIYKKSNDKMNISTAESGNYEVRLNIKYNGKEKISSRTITIKNNQSTIDKGKQDEVIVKQPDNKYVKTYVQAVYEQLFESDFNINEQGYTDRFNVVWGKDNDVDAQLSKKVVIDKASALSVSNKSTNDAGIWANFGSYTDINSLRGKNIFISFYAREISDNTNVEMIVRVKSNNLISSTQDTYDLDYRWSQKSIRVYVPIDANGITVSIRTGSGQEFKIDGFTVSN